MKNLNLNGVDIVQILIKSYISKKITFKNQ